MYVHVFWKHVQEQKTNKNTQLAKKKRKSELGLDPPTHFGVFTDFWIFFQFDKTPKRELRARQRQVHYQYELSYINKLDKANTIDQKLFWHLINWRLKPRAGNGCAFKRPDGQYLTDPITIREE